MLLDSLVMNVDPERVMGRDFPSAANADGDVTEFPVPFLLA
jgi:hypothetical protein